MAGNAAILVPPTLAHNTVENAINSSAAGLHGDRRGHRRRSGALQQAPKDPSDPDSVAPPGAIVMLTDGQNTAGRSPTQEAAEAAKAKVPIYTIAFGNENGYVDLDGKREKVPPDQALLQRISTITNGRAFTAESISQLDSVYKNIRSEVGYEEVRKEVTATWAGYGLAFAVIAALAAVSLGARWP